MSTERWSHDGVMVSTFAGPIVDDSPDRTHVQITTSSHYCILNMDQWRSLVQFIQVTCGDIKAYEWVDREYDSGVVRDGIMTMIELRGETR